MEYFFLTILALLVVGFAYSIISSKQRQKKLQEAHQERIKKREQPKQDPVKNKEVVGVGSELMVDRRSGRDRRSGVERRDSIRFADDRRKNRGRRKEDKIWERNISSTPPPSE